MVLEHMVDWLKLIMCNLIYNLPTYNSSLWGRVENFDRRRVKTLPIFHGYWIFELVASPLYNVLMMMMRLMNNEGQIWWEQSQTSHSPTINKYRRVFQKLC